MMPRIGDVSWQIYMTAEKTQPSWLLEIQYLHKEAFPVDSVYYNDSPFLEIVGGGNSSVFHKIVIFQLPFFGLPGVVFRNLK